MTKKILFAIVAIALLGLIYWGCSSEEYTTAKLALQQKDWERAEEFLIKSLAVEPNNPEVPYQLGEFIYARNKDWAKMNEMFDRALAIDPNRSILDGHSVREYVENSRDKYWVEAYNTAVNVYREVGNAADDEEREALIWKTLEKFQVAALINPGEAQNYSSIAKCYINLGDKDSALQSAVKAAELDPKNADIMLTVGQIAYQSDQCDQAINYYKKAVALDPNNSSSIRSLASVYYDCGDVNEAIVTYESAISKETDPKIKADLYYNLGVLYNQIGDLDQAELNFMTAVDLNPDDVEAIVGMAQVFESAEKWHQAQRFYKQLLAIDPENPNHYKGMARVLLHQGEKEEADYYYRKALEISD